MGKNFIKIILLCLAVFVVVIILFVNRTHSVTFDTKGGTIIRTMEIKHGEKVEKPADPVLEGYTFDGWYLNDKKYDFNEKVTHNITISAKWIEN